MAVARSLKGVSHSGPFLPILFIRQILLCPMPDPRRRRQLNLEGHFLSHGMEAGSLLLVRSVSRPLAFSLLPPSLVHVPTLAAGILKSDNEAEKTGRLVWLEFLLRLYSLVETDNLALAGNILALPR